MAGELRWEQWSEIHRNIIQDNQCFLFFSVQIDALKSEGIAQEIYSIFLRMQMSRVAKVDNVFVIMEFSLMYVRWEKVNKSVGNINKFHKCYEEIKVSWYTENNRGHFKLMVRRALRGYI